MYLDREKPSTFAFVAAGNDPDQKVSSGAFPQAGAAHYPNIVNVTYGGDDDGVKGARTRETDVGVPVHLLARGCFRTSVAAEEFCGSSFASPYVAVTAWLRYLFAGTLPGDMRRTLRYATRPSPGKAETGANARRLRAGSAVRTCGGGAVPVDEERAAVPDRGRSDRVPVGSLRGGGGDGGLAADGRCELPRWRCGGWP